jgi:hypothetical protein
MALIAPIEIASSVDLRVTYWRVGNYVVEPKTHVRVTVLGYWTKADRQALRAPAESRTVLLPNPPANVTIDWIYAQLKSLEFPEAEDDL